MKSSVDDPTGISNPSTSLERGLESNRSTTVDEYKYLLAERELPKSWYNVILDLPQPLSPPSNPATEQPANPGDLEAISPHALIAQEVSSERVILIAKWITSENAHNRRQAPIGAFNFPQTGFGPGQRSKTFGA